MDPVPGWYVDPSGAPDRRRWWDGHGWTEHVAPAAPSGRATRPFAAPGAVGGSGSTSPAYEPGAPGGPPPPTTADGGPTYELEVSGFGASARQLRGGGLLTRTWHGPQVRPVHLPNTRRGDGVETTKGSTVAGGGGRPRVRSTFVLASVAVTILIADRVIRLSSAEGGLTRVTADALGVAVLLVVLLAVHRSRRRHERSDATLTAVVTAIQDGLVVRDNDGQVVMANPAADRLTGLHHHGRADYDQVSRAGYERLDGTLAAGVELPSARARRTGVPVIGEIGRLELEGEGERWVRVSAVPVASKGRAIGTATTITDITDERHASLRLVEAERRLRVAFEGAPIGMVTMDGIGSITGVNPAFVALVGRPAQDLIGLSERALATSDELDADLAGLWALRSGEADTCQFETRYQRPDGRTVCASVHITALHGEGPADTTYLAQVVDLTDELQLREQLAHAASHDPLTDLPNRRLLEDRLGIALAASARDGHSVGLLFCDLDDFKTINDRFGHARGDELLVAIADRLRASLRGDHTVARIGGDEFVVLAPRVDGHTGLDRLRARIRETVEAPLDGGGDDDEVLQPRVSVGAHLARPGTSLETALRAADAAMYRLKTRRRSEDAGVGAN
jgi:diguanylate cyclase (GGDEF)-like protein/PAS domain S-box-containing protein